VSHVLQSVVRLAMENRRNKVITMNMMMMMI
jgi:hypothetical protein